jgi:hypothetical protein
MKRKVGRPSSFNAAIADKLCRELASSSDGLRRICRSNRKFPSRSTVLRWLGENKDFRSQYASARDFQFQSLADEILEIADQVRIGTVTKTHANGKRERRTGDMVDRARLQVDTRKWLLSKLLPKKYGDHLEVETSQGDPISELLEEMRLAHARLPKEKDQTEEEETIQ